MFEKLFICSSKHIFLPGYEADAFRPVRTFDTAVVYYHKFRLVHADTEYIYVVGKVHKSPREKTYLFNRMLPEQPCSPPARSRIH